ncbi:MAG: DMT family transporter [Kiloniellales bacterium]|nr:DMT family transporter [Kiloniellales bacterium]
MTSRPLDTPRTPQRALVTGIAAVCCAVFGFSVADTLAKWLGQEGFTSFQIVFFRYLFGLLPVAVFVWHAGFAALRTRRPLAHGLRACLLFVALSCFFAGLNYLPLAEAIAIAFLAPLFTTALSRPVLGEPVGPRRWGAVLFGFAGALIMLRPGTAAFQPEALLIVASALCFSSAMLLTRRIAPTETNVAILAYSTLGAGLASLPFQAFVWQPPEPGHLWVFLTLGLIGGVAAYFMIVAYRNAPAAVIAPFDYTAMIWGALFGWVFWQERPEAIVILGAVLIAAAGLYITRREAKLGRQSAPGKGA